ncbi:hypothetical protein Dda_9291 [Drechslerella dactyloides]|uniref:Aminotransferase class V domain-containing protein n=1 Tax=Drechslerella dactyloides TaxID=74499 RepID=A0AAD6NFC8_DREDA|nr:hypothetical protein Dda_9291 [Drechslerella dactyloides]
MPVIGICFMLLFKSAGWQCRQSIIAIALTERRCAAIGSSSVAVVHLFEPASGSTVTTNGHKEFKDPEVDQVQDEYGNFLFSDDGTPKIIKEDQDYYDELYNHDGTRKDDTWPWWLPDDATYLDHAGCTLYPTSLMHRFTQDMTSNLFGNPHSASPSSMLSSIRVEDVRDRVLRFFNADPEHFDLVFVANATAGIKMVMDGFRDLPTGYWYGYHRDAHNSLVGVREHANSARCFANDDEVEKWIAEEDEDTTSTSARLFAYPAQSNMNGRRSPLRWCSEIRRSKPCTYTLLDAAAFLTTGCLDLSNHEEAPDFICMSFYKIFGYPDLGGLIVRKASGDMLTRRKYFAGGTVEMVLTVGSTWHIKRDGVHETLEDGTLPFHNIVALGHALDVYTELYTSPRNVSAHASALAKSAYDRLSSLRYSNGAPVCEIHKDSLASYDDSTTQGPTVAFNVRRPDGSWLGKSVVEHAAIQHGIHMRSGGVCNPGGTATVLQLSPQEMHHNYDAGQRCGDTNDVMGGKPTGILRISLGAMSSMEDVDRFVKFMKEWCVKQDGAGEVPTVPVHLTPKTGFLKVKIMHVSGAEKSKGFRYMLKNITSRSLVA